MQLDFEVPSTSFSDNTISKFEGGKTFQAGDKRLELLNKLSLAYGQICSLAGDYFGTTTLISDGNTPQEYQDNFMRAWESFAVREDADIEDTKILNILDPEMKAVQKAIEGKTPLR